MILEKNREQWNKIYQKETKLLPIDNDIKEITILFKKKNVKKILDLACGSGRHVLYLTENGFDVHGIDISDKGIEIANSLLKKRNLYDHLKVGSMYDNLPFENNYFDAIICIRALNHGTIEEIRNGIKEIERVLKSHGILYLTVRKRISKIKRLPFNEIAPRTYMPIEGDEKGIIHYLFNIKILRKEFKNFLIKKLWIKYGPKSWEAYYHLLGELKEKNTFQL